MSVLLKELSDLFSLLSLPVLSVFLKDDKY